MIDFEVKKNQDGSYILLNRDGVIIDGETVKDDGFSPVQIWATARAATGQLFYTRIPVTREMLKHDPEMAESRLRMFAENWERGYEQRKKQEEERQWMIEQARLSEKRVLEGIYGKQE